MKPFYKTVGPCIIIFGLGLEFALYEERHNHIEQRQYEMQTELTKQPSYSTASITHIQLFPTSLGHNLLRWSDRNLGSTWIRRPGSN